MNIHSVASHPFRPKFPNGLYGITPDWHDAEKLSDAVCAAAAGGMRVVQLRSKTASPELRLKLAQRLMQTCHHLGVLLIINDDWQFTLQLNMQGLKGVHIGRDDGTSQTVRAQLGNGFVLGVSCYDDLNRAIAATAPVEPQHLGPTVDYVAFGAMFASGTKPHAPPAALNILTQARHHWHGKDTRPALVAIGGITVDNAAMVIAAGADALAVAGGLFLSPHIEQTARRFTDLFAEMSSHTFNEQSSQPVS